ncbi:hypothetical protein GY45DRAFT_311917 [Cubamyces sp. BRFM 1775]|nr:hypothetical protein GY45DRAFT_311917 [Cubamyces sp. BRFM 1775]
MHFRGISPLILFLALGISRINRKNITCNKVGLHIFYVTHPFSLKANARHNSISLRTLRIGRRTANGSRTRRSSLSREIFLTATAWATLTATSCFLHLSVERMKV